MVVVGFISVVFSFVFYGVRKSCNNARKSRIGGVSVALGGVRAFRRPRRRRGSGRSRGSGSCGRGPAAASTRPPPAPDQRARAAAGGDGSGSRGQVRSPGGGETTGCRLCVRGVMGGEGEGAANGSCGVGRGFIAARRCGGGLGGGEARIPVEIWVGQAGRAPSDRIACSRWNSRAAPARARVAPWPSVPSQQRLSSRLIDD